MSYCQSCGSKVPSNAQFCSQCGVELDEIEDITKTPSSLVLAQTNTVAKSRSGFTSLVIVLASLFFITTIVIVLASSQGSLYDIVTITLAALGTLFSFFQLSTPITLPAFPSLKRVPSLKTLVRPHPYIMLITSVLLVVASTLNIFFPKVVLQSPLNPCQSIATSQNTSTSDSIISRAPDGECIGISDGTFFFDKDLINRPKDYNDTKSKVLKLLKKGNVRDAEQLWRKVRVTNDAEMLIYLEDQRVIASYYPFVTLVVAGMITGQYATVGRDVLQGAYVAQKELNDFCGLPSCMQMRILIANSGSGSGSGDRALYASITANQIVQEANRFNIKGVLGWPYSGQTVNAIPVLGPAHIPLLSPISSSDSLTGVSYFSRVAPPDTFQARAGANYAINKLHAKKVAVFYDPTDPYCRSLGESFIREFESVSHATTIKELYTVGKTNEDIMGSLLRDSLRQAPDLDLIYFSGYAQDAAPLIARLPSSKLYTNLRLMGGDGLYDPSDYPSGEYPENSFSRFYFTAFAYPDEWDFLHLQNPPFFCEYTKGFDPSTQCPGPNTNKKYGYNRANGFTILSYDGMVTLAHACGIAFTKVGAKFSPDDVQNSIATIVGSNAIQGVSGQISLGSDGDPINKAVVILFVDAKGNTQMDGLENCFIKGSCSNS